MRFILFLGGITALALGLASVRDSAAKANAAPSQDYRPLSAASLSLSSDVERPTPKPYPPNPNPPPVPKPNPPPPAPKGDCENCDGTGILGDGTIRIKCPECDGTGKKKKQPPPEDSLDQARNQAQRLGRPLVIYVGHDVPQGDRDRLHSCVLVSVPHGNPCVIVEYPGDGRLQGKRITYPQGIALMERSVAAWPKEGWGENNNREGWQEMSQQQYRGAPTMQRTPVMRGRFFGGRLFSGGGSC